MKFFQATCNNISQSRLILYTDNNALGASRNVLANPLLGNISFVDDYPQEGDVNNYCTMGPQAEYLVDGLDGDLTARLVVCPAGSEEGGIYKGYSGVAPVKCSGLDAEVSWRMRSLGSNFLHEFMHFSGLVRPPLTRRPTDNAYHPWGVRTLDKTLAAYNADSFQWYALETFWSAYCKYKFLDPIKPEAPASWAE